MRAAILIAIVAVVFFPNIYAGEPEQISKPEMRIGVYDSRAVAVAFAGSKVFKSWLKNLRLKHSEAKAAGDQKRVAELEAEAKKQQKLLHQQGFSTAPVDNILQHMKKELPKIKKEANVDLIVSKWDHKRLAKYKSAEQVDITMALVMALKPNAKQIQAAKAIMKHPPVSLKELEKHMSEDH